MKTAVAAVAAPPNDDERRRFLSALNALLHKRLTLEMWMFESHRFAVKVRHLDKCGGCSSSLHAGGQEP